MLSAIAAISGLYDFVVGAFLLFGADALASRFGVPPANPRIFSDLNALFLMAVGTGYYFPWRDPARHRGYMWIMGPLLKGAGAIVFVLDYLLSRLARVIPVVCGVGWRARARDAVGAGDFT